MKMTVGLLLDLGNSETRMTVITSKKNYFMTFSNKHVELPFGYSIAPEYLNDKSTIYKVEGSYFANGLIVEREFVGKELRPVALKPKTEQQVTMLTLNLAFSKALMLLSQVNNMDISLLDVTFKVYLVVPPLEHENHKELLESKIKQIYGIEVFSPMRSVVNFAISDIKIYPEGVAAFIGACFTEEDNDIVSVESNEMFESGYVLVLDIGAGTTDIVLIKDSELILDSKDTINKGGNLVDSQLRNAIKRKFGYTPEVITDCIQRGVLVEGTEEIDVTDLLDEAKDKYSTFIMEQLNQYFERMMIDVPRIKGLLVAGGGSLPAIRDGQVVSPAMSDVFLKYFKDLAPRVTVMNLDGKNPRHLNIEGLRYLYKFDNN